MCSAGPIAQEHNISFAVLLQLFAFLLLSSEPPRSIDTRWILRWCRRLFCHLKKFSWGGRRGGGSVFSSVFGKFKHIRQKDFLLQKALSKSLSRILPSHFLLLFFYSFFSHALVSLLGSSAESLHCHGTTPYRCWGNPTRGPPNPAGHSKHSSRQTPA